MRRLGLWFALGAAGCGGELVGPVRDAGPTDAERPADAADIGPDVPDLGPVDADAGDVGDVGVDEVPSVARRWDDTVLRAIRRDLPRPPVHARNLYHFSAAMYDAWCAYDATCDGVYVREKHTAPDLVAARREAVSYAAYGVLLERYRNATNGATSAADIRAELVALGYDPDQTGTVGDSPGAFGRRVAEQVLLATLNDGARESSNYDDPSYVPVNEPLVVKLPGITMLDPDRWQPLSLDFMLSQNGIPIPGKIQIYVGSHWNAVTPFALTRTSPNALFVDPGAPPRVGSTAMRDQVVEVIRLASYLDPADPTLVELSPSVKGNQLLGTNDGIGHAVDPSTGRPYPSNLVPRVDYGRFIAEYWADGPQSETPPGHWNVIANMVGDAPTVAHRVGPGGPQVSRLEWDVKLYLALNGAVHDAAVACWGAKRFYDSSRPISLVRYMGGLGQSSDPSGASYHANGLPLVPGLIELVTAQSSAPGERHAHLASYVGEVAVRAWPGEPTDPVTQTAGVRWVRAVEWVPYQRKTFVTPPFAAYISGHSTYSRASAEVLAAFTGSPFFPGGSYSKSIAANSFVQEQGPTAPFTVQWATYYDAADEAGRSRLWGGIHIEADDFGGRRVGHRVGLEAYARAQRYFAGVVIP